MTKRGIHWLVILTIVASLVYLVRKRFSSSYSIPASPSTGGISDLAKVILFPSKPIGISNAKLSPWDQNQPDSSVSLHESVSKLVSSGTAVKS